MPDDQYLYMNREKHQLEVNRGGIQNEEQANQSVYKTSMDDWNRMNDALQASKYKDKDDSLSMSKVKNDMTVLTDLMYVEIDTNNFELELSTIMNKFEILLASCKEYLDSHFSLFGDGAARIKLVKNLRKQIESDYKVFSENSYRLKPNVNAGMAWGNVIGEIRKKEIPADVMNEARKSGDSKIIELNQTTYEYTKFDSDNYKMNLGNVGACSLFNIIGENDLCVEAHRTNYKKKGKYEQGVVIEKIKLQEVDSQNSDNGFVRMNELLREHDDVIYTPECLKKMTKIKLIDIIMGYRSRSTDTMAVRAVKNPYGKIEVLDVKVIDTPRAFTMFGFEHMDVQSIKALDVITAYEIMALTNDMLDYALGDTVGQARLNAVHTRLAELQQYIRNEMQEDEERSEKEQFIVRTDKWNESHVVRFCNDDQMFSGMTLDLQNALSNTTKERDSIQNRDEIEKELNDIKQKVWGTDSEEEKNRFIDKIVKDFFYKGYLEENNNEEANNDKERLKKEGRELLLNIKEEICSDIDKYNDNRGEVLDIYRELVKLYDCEDRIKAQIEAKTLNSKEGSMRIKYIDSNARALEKKLHKELNYGHIYSSSITDENVDKVLPSVTEAVNSTVDVEGQRLLNIGNQIEQPNELQNQMRDQLKKVVRLRKRSAINVLASTSRIVNDKIKNYKIKDEFNEIAFNSYAGLSYRYNEFMEKNPENKDVKEYVRPDILVKAFREGKLYQSYIERILYNIEAADATEFSFSDENSFLNDFARKYSKLKFYAQGEKLIDLLRDENGNVQISDGKSSKSVIVSKSRYFKALLEKYERQIDNIMSEKGCIDVNMLEKNANENCNSYIENEQREEADYAKSYTAYLKKLISKGKTEKDKKEILKKHFLKKISKKDEKSFDTRIMLNEKPFVSFTEEEDKLKYLDTEKWLYTKIRHMKRTEPNNPIIKELEKKYDNIKAARLEMEPYKNACDMINSGVYNYIDLNNRFYSKKEKEEFGTLKKLMQDIYTEMYSEMDTLSQTKYVGAHDDLKNYIASNNLVVEKGEITKDFKYKEEYDQVSEITQPSSYYEKGGMKVGVYYQFAKLNSLVSPDFVYPDGIDYKALGEDLKLISDSCKKFLTLHNMDMSVRDLDDDFNAMYLKQDLSRTINYETNKLFEKYGLNNSYLAYEDQIAANKVKEDEKQK
ncbi:MAG: hypothetical protein K6B41_14610 [Butyrivibrio sp.]|nr:hypothetical protein [Butyrivibrio sp.]